MPLEPGKSREAVSRNISEMIRAGHPQKVAVAASLSEARKPKKKRGSSHDRMVEAVMDKARRSKARRTLGKKRKKMKHPELRGRVLPV